MISALILTIIVLLLFWLVQQYAIAGAPFDAKVKWGITAIAVLIAVMIIAGIWGIIPPDLGWHH